MSIFIANGVAAFITLALVLAPAIALHLLFGLFALASVAEGIASVILIERDIRA